MASKSRKSIWISFRHVLEYAALRLLAGLLRLMGIDAASAMMGRAWQKVGPHTRRHERVKANLTRAFPDLPKARIDEIALQQWNNLGRTFAESFLIDRFFAEPDRIDFRAGPIADRLEGSGKGFVLVSLHTANWELICIPVAGRFELTGLYQKLSNPLADDYLTAMRRTIYRGGLLSKSVSTPRTAMRIARDGGGVAILADQRERKGIEVEFFGQKTKANPFPAMIARRLDIPLVAGRTVRTGGARFHVEAAIIDPVRTDDASADVEAITQAIQKQFEDWIRDCPGQWMWIHDRWRIGHPRRGRRRPALDKSGPSAN
jgi:KDO2-lipid IV(A) lauroyltransferase